MRLNTAVKLGAAGIVVVVIAAIGVAKSIDITSYQRYLVREVKEATGRDLVIDGPMKLSLGFTPRITARAVSFANAPWSSHKEMATVEVLEAEIALIPLLSHEIRVNRLKMVNPTLWLETDAKGRGNWQLAPLATAQPAPERSQPPSAGTKPIHYDVGSIAIDNAKITWRDGATGKVTEMAIDKATAHPDAKSERMFFDLAGAIDGEHFEFGGSIGKPSAAPAPVTLKANIAGALAVVEGSVADPARAKGIDLKLSAQGEDLGHVLAFAGLKLDGTPVPTIGPFKLQGRLTDAGGPIRLSIAEAAAGRRDRALLSVKGDIRDVAALSGIDLALSVESDNLAGFGPMVGKELPAIGPVKLAGRLTTTAQSWHLADIKGAVGGSDLRGDLVLTSGRRPHLTGTLASDAMDIADFVHPPAKPGEKRAAGSSGAKPSGRVFSAEPLPFETMGAVDADLSVTVKRLTAGGSALEDAAFTLGLDRGRLQVRPATARLAGGTITLAALLDGNAHSFALRAEAGGVQMGRLLSETSTTNALVGGTTKAFVDVKGTGDSVRAIMASLDGDALVQMGEGRIKNEAVDWGAGDLFVNLANSVNPLGERDKATELRCAVARFQAKRGVVQTRKGIAAETSRVNVTGSGTIDLRSEGLDLAVSPRPVGGIGLSLGSFAAKATRIRGTLAAPSVGLDEIGVAGTVASTGAAIASGGISLLGELIYDRATADDHPCRTALAAPAPDKAKKR